MSRMAKMGNQPLVCTTKRAARQLFFAAARRFEGVVEFFDTVGKSRGPRADEVLARPDERRCFSWRA